MGCITKRYEKVFYWCFFGICWYHAWGYGQFNGGHVGWVTVSWCRIGFGQWEFGGKNTPDIGTESRNYGWFMVHLNVVRNTLWKLNIAMATYPFLDDFTLLSMSMFPCGPWWARATSHGDWGPADFMGMVWVDLWQLPFDQQKCGTMRIMTGWWFGTWVLWLSIQLGIIIPTDEVHHFSEGSVYHQPDENRGTKNHQNIAGVSH